MNHRKRILVAIVAPVVGFFYIFIANPGRIDLVGLALLALLWVGAYRVLEKAPEWMAGLRQRFPRQKREERSGESEDVEPEPAHRPIEDGYLSPIPTPEKRRTIFLSRDFMDTGIDSIQVSATPRGQDTGLLQGVPEAHTEVLALLHERDWNVELPRGSIRGLYEDRLMDRRIGPAEEALREHILPRVDEDLYQAIMHAGGGSRFASGDDLVRTDMLVPESGRKPDAIRIGMVEPPTVRPECPLLFQGEGHLATVATTGAGKNRRYIMPALMTYPGSVVCLDPKGENYRVTKGQRDLLGSLFKWAPFDPNGDTDSFNPLDAVKDWNDARVLADLLINPSEGGEQRFWELSARDVVRGLIMYVRTLPEERRNMRHLVGILYSSKDDLLDVRDQLTASDDLRLQELANQLEVMAEKMFESILQSARAELDVWRSDEIARATSTTSKDWNVAQFVEELRVFESAVGKGAHYRPNSYGYVVTRECDGSDEVYPWRAASVFLIVPAHQIRTCASVLRVMLGIHLNAFAREEERYDSLPDDRQPLYKAPTLFVFDELAQLGYMQIVEEQITIARSARIRIWLISQDLPQLKRTYRGWESMLANCRAQVFFGVNDNFTADHIARTAGEKTDVFGTVKPLVPASEVRGPTYRDHALVISRNNNVAKVKLPPHYNDDLAMRRIETFLRRKGLDIPERERGSHANGDATVEAGTVQPKTEQSPTSISEEANAASNTEPTKKPTDKATAPQNKSAGAPIKKRRRPRPRAQPQAKPDP